MDKNREDVKYRLYRRISHKRIYNLAHMMARLVLKRFFDFEVSGEENIPRSGPVIVASNHLSYLDPVIIGCSVDREMHYMAKNTLFFGPIMGGLFRHVNAYPVKRGTPDRASLKKTFSLLKEGKAVLVFPEGTRSFSQQLGKAKSGVGFLVCRSEAHVIPALIEGSQEAWGRGRWFPRRARIKATFGKIIDLEDLRKAQMTRETYDKAGERLMQHIAELQES